LKSNLKSNLKGKLSKVETLKKSNEIREVMIAKKSSKALSHILFVKHTGKSPRVGYIVSKRVGNAVARNKVKRRFREIVRLCQAKLYGFDIVVLASPLSSELKYERLAQDFVKNFVRTTKATKATKATKTAKGKVMIRQTNAPSINTGNRHRTQIRHTGNRHRQQTPDINTYHRDGHNKHGHSE
jgi:ribonuclease P protein component